MKKFVKNIICISILVLVGMQTNHLLVFYTLFKLNQDNLSQVVCEQKVKSCNACCYLTKKINEESNDSRSASKNTTKIDIKILEYTVNTFSYNPLYNNQLLSYFNAGDIILSGYIGLPDHPPRS